MAKAMGGDGTPRTIAAAVAVRAVDKNARRDQMWFIGLEQFAEALVKVA
jgi:hypothetical protein